MAEMTWELFHQQVACCAMCPLCEGIHHKVPGQGRHDAPLMLIGEGPGQGTWQNAGEPFQPTVCHL